ncbi:hypothetical protein ACIHAR_07335 [Streptomyces sp. NPDC052016]|uniref:hypothetical protein n=1 Tax=Streptomyces sp. NPDC052016 TaxID=3365680 RepID=UPI0037D23288
MMAIVIIRPVPLSGQPVQFVAAAEANWDSICSRRSRSAALMNRCESLPRTSRSGAGETPAVAMIAAAIFAGLSSEGRLRLFEALDPRLGDEHGRLSTSVGPRSPRSPPGMSTLAATPALSTGSSDQGRVDA